MTSSAAMQEGGKGKSRWTFVGTGLLRFLLLLQAVVRKTYECGMGKFGTLDSNEKRLLSWEIDGGHSPPNRKGKNKAKYII